MQKYQNLNELSQKEYYNGTEKVNPEFTGSSPYVIVDPACGIVHCNSAFKKKFGLEETDNLSSLKSEPNLVYTIMAFIKSGFENLRFELVHKIINGTLNQYIYSVEISRIRISGSQYYSLYFNSLEPNWKIEDQLNNLHFALEYGNIPVMILSCKGEVKYCSKSFEKLLNKTIDELYESSILTELAPFLKPDDLIKLEEALNGAKKWVRSITCVEELGTPGYRDLKLNPVKRESSDSVFFILTAADITHYVMKNHIVKKSEERLKSLINNISDHLLIVRYSRGAHLFETANDNFCNTFHVNRKESLHKDISAVLKPFLHKKLTEVFADCEAGKQFNFEYEVEENKTSHFAVKVTYLDDKPDNDRYYIISFKDITSQILSQRQLQKAYEKENHLNRLKTSFLENMSHEIRTPFNAIMGYSEILDECLQSEDYSAISEISHSVKDVLQRILNLFNNIVDVSQAESTEIEINKKITNAGSIIENVYLKKLPDAERKNIIFKTSGISEDVTFETDGVKLEKILLALVDNAIKYTDKGYVLVRLDKKPDNIRIEISDTGRGMDENSLSRLIEPFAQEEEGYTRNYQGAGLGLSIAYYFTKALGGTFNIKSEKGKGTTITLTFPPN